MSFYIMLIICRKWNHGVWTTACMYMVESFFLLSWQNSCCLNIAIYGWQKRNGILIIRIFQFAKSKGSFYWHRVSRIRARTFNHIRSLVWDVITRLDQNSNINITETPLQLSPPGAAYLRVRESGQHWFSYWLVAYSAPRHYLNQCWANVNWTHRNKLQWNFTQNTKLSIHENASENIVCEMAAILSRGEMS